MTRRILLTPSCALAAALAVLPTPTAGAATKVATLSKFTKVSAVSGPPAGEGFGSRLDGIYVSGGTAWSYENVTKVKDTARPSDHNLVLSTLVLEK